MNQPLERDTASNVHHGPCRTKVETRLAGQHLASVKWLPEGYIERHRAALDLDALGLGGLLRAQADYIDRNPSTPEQDFDIWATWYTALLNYELGDLSGQLLWEGVAICRRYVYESASSEGDCCHEYAG